MRYQLSAAGGFAASETGLQGGCAPDRKTC